MKYRLLALDIDGTIRNTQHCITSRTRDAILRVQKAGVCVAIASGRTAYGVRGTVEELELARYGGYAISSNGAQIHSAATGALIRETLLPKGFAGKMSAFCTARGLDFMGFEDKYVLTNNPNSRLVQAEALQDGMELKLVPDFSQYNDAHMCKFIIAAEETELLRLKPEMDAYFGDTVAIFRSEPYYMEFQRAGVNKGAGVQCVMEQIECGADAVVACGNAYNDVFMLRLAAVGVAVANAPIGVQNQADMVTASCDEDGIAKAIDLLF